MDLRDVHYDYIIDVMEQDPEVIRNMCYLLDEIQLLTFICDVDVAVCQTLVDPSSDAINKLIKEVKENLDND